MKGRLENMKISLLFLMLISIVPVTTAVDPYPIGDLNQNLKVNLEDLVIFAEQWMEFSSCEGLNCAELDGLNGINILDFVLLASNWLEDFGLPLVINEFMASNNSDSGISDPQGEFDDWIEIYNYGDAAIDLAGMYLTDDLDDPTAWQFPPDRPAETTIDPNGFLVVWADEDILDTPGLHADFQLDAGGEEIGLFDADGTTLVDSIVYGDQISNISYGCLPDGYSTLRFFAIPTPGAANDNAYLGLVADTKFSHDRGFYDDSFSLSITCTTPGANLYYTTDGSAPIENEVPAAAAIHYTGPISISDNACIRAAAVKTGWLPTNIDTHTYIFDANPVIRSMPLISLVGDEYETFYGPEGILPNATVRGLERPVSFEYFEESKGIAFQEDGGIRVHGSDYTRPRYTIGEDWLTCWTSNWPNWNSNRFSFNVWFRSIYGSSRLEYPMFPFIDVDRFESIVLRAGHNDGCTPFVKDEWTRRLFREMGYAQVTGMFGNLYLNGRYKSYYNPTARGDKEFYQEWYGTDNEFDVITQSGVRDGDNVAWNSLLNYANSHDLSNTVDYEYMASRMDIPNFIDYLILQIHIGNFDWPGNNWDVHRERTEDAKFRFSIWDAEGLAETWIFGNNGENMYKTAFEDFPDWSNPRGLNNMTSEPNSQLYRALRANAEFRRLFADRIHRHFRNDGILTEEHQLARWWEVFGEVSPVLPETSHFPVRYVPDTFIPLREMYVLSAFEDNGLFDLSFGYPVFNINGTYQHGGYIDSGDIFTITQSTASGTLYFTTDGSDPRADSQTSSEWILVTEAASKKVLVPTGPLTGAGSISNEYWTGISGTLVTNLTSHANYPDNPSSTGSLTGFEIPTNSMDNYGTRVRGYLNPPTSGVYTFWIASDDSSELWLSSDDDPAHAGRIAYVNGWTSSREWSKYATQESANISLISGQTYYIEALHKEGGGYDNLAVAWDGPGFNRQVIAGSYLTPFTRAWTAVYYDDSSWTSGFGGVGYENYPTDPVNYSSLIDTDVKAEMVNSNATCYIRIPFMVSAEDLVALTNLSLHIRYDDGFIAYINGVKAAEDYADSTPSWNSVSSGQRDDNVCVNVRSIDISSHIGHLVPGDNVLSIHGMNVSADSPDFLITAELAATRSNAGSVAPTAIEYTGGLSLLESTEIKARILSGTGQWSVLNEAVFAVGPVAQNLRISEIMYHPPDPNEEFIELINTGSQSINLNLVRFTKGIDFTFGDEILDPDEYILVVRNQAAFLNQYPDFTGTIAGEYEGALDNGGEKIRLRDALDAIIQEFTYKDGWYEITDGDGFSLTIRDPYSSDPNDWDDKDGWRPSAAVGGSPGFDDAGLLPDPGSVVINEVLAHSHGGNPDWIELHNTTGQSINIGGWFLSDSNANDPNIMKYQIPVGTSIPADGYTVFYEDLHFGNPAAPGVNTPFALSEGGDTVYLRSGFGDTIGGYEESESFGASATGVAFGRHIKSTLDGGINFVAMSTNTLNARNAYPRVGPVIITEIMYNPDPANTGGEYIELHNITAAPVTLQDSVSTEILPGVFDTEVMPWQFSDGIDFLFPANTTIPAGGYLIIAADPAAFSSYYGAMPSGVDVIGPFQNDTALNNGGEQVQIVRPGDKEYGSDRYWIRTERVTYDDADPWPTSPDGGGDVLKQKTPDTAGANYSNDVINWQAAAPDPGQ